MPLRRVHHIDLHVGFGVLLELVHHQRGSHRGVIPWPHAAVDHDDANAVFCHNITSYLRSRHGFVRISTDQKQDPFQSVKICGVLSYAKSNSNTSDRSCAPVMATFCSSLTAAPSPCSRRVPFNSTDPLATWSQAWRPGASACSTFCCLSSSAT